MYEQFYGKLYGKCSAYACIGYQAVLPPPPQKAWDEARTRPTKTGYLEQEVDCRLLLVVGVVGSRVAAPIPVTT